MPEDPPLREGRSGGSSGRAYASPPTAGTDREGADEQCQENPELLNFACHKSERLHLPNAFPRGFFSLEILSEAVKNR